MPGSSPGRVREHGAGPPEPPHREIRGEYCRREDGAARITPIRFRIHFRFVSQLLNELSDDISLRPIRHGDETRSRHRRGTLGSRHAASRPRREHTSNCVESRRVEHAVPPGRLAKLMVILSASPECPDAAPLSLSSSKTYHRGVAVARL